MNISVVTLVNKEKNKTCSSTIMYQRISHMKYSFHKLLLFNNMFLEVLVKIKKTTSNLVLPRGRGVI